MSNTETKPTTARYLNRASRRFLQRCGWGKIPPRTCSERVYLVIKNLQFKQASIQTKKQLLYSILSS